MSVLAIVALIAVPAFAEVQNVKVSGDIDSKMITRNNYDFGVAATNDNDTWFMSVARIQVDADLTDNVSTCVRLLNQRDWDIATAGAEEIVLDLASVKMKEMFYAPLTMTIGKQNLRFGNGLVVAQPDPSSAGTGMTTAITALDLDARKSFDALRATLDYNPLTVDLIFAKINAGTLGSKKNNDDMNLYGINAAYKFDKYNSEAEAYIFSRQNRAGDTAPQLTDTCNTYGIRGSLEPISKLSVGGEVAIQDGDYVNAAFNKTIDRSAWAADLNATFAIDYKWSPKVGLKYSYRSGNKNTGNIGGTDVDALATNSEYKAWDAMYEDQVPGIIANYIFDGANDGVGSNGQTINVMASVVPVQDLTVAVDYYLYSLVEKWYAAGDATDLRTLNGTAYKVLNKTNLGQEVDLSLGYDYTEDVKLGLTAGFSLPGEAFQRANDSMASTVMADVKVAF